MKKKYTYLTASVLTAVTMLPTFAPSEAHAAYNWNGNNSYYTRTSAVQAIVLLTVLLQIVAAHQTIL